jgi:hypothetical protein
MVNAAPTKINYEGNSPHNRKPQAVLIGSDKPVIINSKRVMIGGDVITSIYNQSIYSMEDLQQYLVA